MSVLRWLLVLANAGFSVAFVVAARHYVEPVGIAMGTVAMLNVLYLLMVQPGEPGRAKRMLGLWLSAKESDLQSRAQR